VAIWEEVGWNGVWVPRITKYFTGLGGETPGLPYLNSPKKSFPPLIGGGVNLPLIEGAKIESS